MAIIPYIKKRFRATGSPVKWLTGAQYDDSSVTERALAWADAGVGIREHGPNKGADVVEIQRTAGLGNQGGFAWCAAFVYWALVMAGVDPSALPARGHAAAVWRWVEWAKAKGRIISSPKRGCLFWWLDSINRGHMGFCLGPFILGITRTIEGNTNEAGSREGEGSYKRTRLLVALKKNHRHGYIDLSGLPLLKD